MCKGGVQERVSQFDEALEPFGVGHFLDVAEVWLRRLVQRGDDFFAVDIGSKPNSDVAWKNLPAGIISQSEVLL